MATLEKIRNKSVLLFIVIIGALLAFILGDFLTSGKSYFSDPTTVAKAAGQKVEYDEYQQRLAQLSEQQRNNNYDADAASQQVLNELLTEKLLQKEYKDLGIVVTDKELSMAMTGENIHPAAYQTIAALSQQLGLEQVSGAEVLRIINDPKIMNLPDEAVVQLKQIWAQTENEVEKVMLSEKFYRLLNGLYVANKVDAKALYDDNAASRHISYAAKDVSSVADDAVKFTDEDIKAYWEEHKNEYKLEDEVRSVDYIVVAIEPSESDRLAAQRAVENAIDTLSKSEGTRAIASDTRFNETRVTRPASAITDRTLRSFVTDSTAGIARVVNQTNDSYTIAKVLSTHPGIDSINVTAVRSINPLAHDSIIELFNAGSKFAEIVDNNTIVGQDSTWFSLEAPGMDAKLKEALTDASIGKPFVHVDSINGQDMSVIYIVNKRNAPVTHYEIATIEFPIDPSQETISQLHENLRTYVSNNSSAEDFVKNAPNAGFTIQNAQVGKSSPRLGMSPDSRKFVKWAMDAKKGQVSPMLEDDKATYIIAMALSDIYKDGYMPYNSPAIAERVRQEALNSKKADKLIADYAGKAKDVAGYAQVMEVESSEGDVNFNSPMFLNMGTYESALQGAVAAADKGQVVGPVKGNHAVIVFQVTDINNDNRPFTEEEYGRRFVQSFGFGRLPSPLPLLLGKEKVDNRSLNFVSSPVQE